MFLSRFPSLSTHKAWEGHSKEADVGARGSLELFWQSKGHGSMTRYLSRIFFPELLVLILSNVRLHFHQDNGRQEGIVSVHCSQ